MSGIASRPEPSGTSSRWVMRLCRMSRWSLAAGVVEDSGSWTSSSTSMPRTEGSGSGSGFSSGCSGTSPASQSAGLPLGMARFSPAVSMPTSSR